MKALLKHTLRSAADSKAQIAIIILTVAVVTAMIFVAFSISDVFYNVNMTENDRVAQGADMLLGSNGSAGEYFSRARVESVLSENAEEVVQAEYFLKFTTVLRHEGASKTILLEATDMNDYIARHELRYVERSVDRSGAMPIIIGKTFADSAGLHAGDTVEIYIPSHNDYVETYVAYVAADEGIFHSASGMNVLADFTSVGNYGLVSAVYITFTDPALFGSYEAAFEEILPAVNCSEGNDISGVSSIIFNNTLLFAVGVMFIIATMCLILLTSYMIISRKRTREMVVFKAAGATPAQTALIMLMEVAVCAIIGASIGLAVGRLSMQITVESLTPYALEAVTYGFWKYLVSFFIAVSVTIIASLAPVITVSKQTIRQLTSESPRIAKKPKPIIFAALTLATAGALAATSFLEGIWVAALSILDIAIVVVWISFAMPLALKGATYLLSKIKSAGGFGLGTLTPNRNKAMRTVTTLVAVIIAFSFTVVEIVSLVKFAVTPFTQRYSADAVVVVSSEVSDEERFRLNNALYVDGVEAAGYMNDVDFLLEQGRMDLVDSGKYFTLYGVSDFWMLEHCAPNLDEGTQERWNNTQNPVVLSRDMMLRLGLETGDTLDCTPQNEDYQNRSFSFTVVGVDDTVTRYDRVGYVRFDSLAEISTVSTCFVEYAADADPNVVLPELIGAVDALGLERSFVLTFSEWASAGNDGIESIMGILGFMQYAVIAVGLIGIINISIVTFFDRRAELELYRLSGMSKKEYLGFSAAEGAGMALAGGLIGFAVCTALNRLLPVFVGIVDKYLVFPVISALSAAITAGAALAFAGCWMLIAAVRRRAAVKSLNERFMN